MIRKMISLLACVVLALSLTTAMAETATEWLTVQLNNGAYVVAPSDYYVLVPGMTDDEIAAQGLTLTADYVDQLLTSQGMQLDCIAPDVNCEYLIGFVPYQFTDFSECSDALLKSAIPALESSLAPGGVTIDDHDILRWESEDGSKDAYILMEQTQTDANGNQLKRLHAYSVKGNYGINVILIAYTTEITDAQAELLGTVISNIILPQ